LVIVDAGPVDSTLDTLGDEPEACPVDTAIVLRDVRRSSEVQTLRAAERLRTRGVPAVGIAENFISQDTNG
jgi:Mrp family chromosome partitioning ATPase